MTRRSTPSLRPFRLLTPCGKVVTLDQLLALPGSGRLRRALCAFYLRWHWPGRPAA